jgi:hypothetical protein
VDKVAQLFKTPIGFVYLGTGVFSLETGFLHLPVMPLDTFLQCYQAFIDVHRLFLRESGPLTPEDILPLP